ncbi:MAG: tRNA (N(6)-L-threonylcarbamoyladenosine(37)-C(2))-methylthiotransferase MtaB [bacterium]|nr:tRNA (N(6)-L-threonylcarbamoyladenosine(37)-C(2))-methylthiotransferase MtaB [bacterium]
MKVHLRMLGCRLNQAEIDQMARQLTAQGHEVVASPEEADQFIVNTCAVTQDATRSSRHLIRDLHKLNPNAQTTVTGCYAQISPDEIAVLPSVARVVDNMGKDTLVEQLTGVKSEPFDDEPLARESQGGGRTRAFIKAQDGCDNSCTFCVTTIARGEGRSRSLVDVVEEIRYLHEVMGYQEAVLTGVHLGSYGHDRGEQYGLSALVRAILAETDIPRLRLSSLEPWDLSPDFFELWENKRLCRHLHLPLQSGCDATLKRMRRNTNQANFRMLVNQARVTIPDVCITTDVIVGFPHETDEEFDISKAFIEEMDFAGMHIFRYSKRPGTPASRMKFHVDEASKKIRSAQLHALAQNGQKRYAMRFQDMQQTVLWENVMGATPDGFINVGYTDTYLRVKAIHPRPLTNHLIPVTLGVYDEHTQVIEGVVTVA